MSTMISEVGSGVYAIRHIDSLRSYVGSAVNLRRRWRNHQGLLRRGIHHSIRLQSAWNKYSEERFEFLVLEEVPGKQDLILCEQRWIDQLKAHLIGYNVCSIAYSRLGTKASEATRRKQSEAMRDFKPTRTAAFLELARSSRLGTTHSLEVRKKMSEAHMGTTRAPFTATHRENIRLSKLGQIQSDAKREKLRVATTAFWARKRAGDLA